MTSGAVLVVVMVVVVVVVNVAGETASDSAVRLGRLKDEQARGLTSQPLEPEADIFGDEPFFEKSKRA